MFDLDCQLPNRKHLLGAQARGNLTAKFKVVWSTTYPFGAYGSRRFVRLISDSGHGNLNIRWYDVVHSLTPRCV